MTEITKITWTAGCSCGWQITAPNDLFTVLFQVRTHLAAFHRESDVAVATTIVGTVSTRLDLDGLNGIVAAPDAPTRS